MAQLVKNLPAVPETWVRSLGWEDSLEKGKAAYSSILAWRIPCPWGYKELDTTEQLSLHFVLKSKQTDKSQDIREEDIFCSFGVVGCGKDLKVSPHILVQPLFFECHN